jgi:hypothetical protein
VNDSGSETVAGDNPTPDQSLVEENASAMGVSYEDNEELEFIDKIESAIANDTSSTRTQKRPKT